MPDFIERYVDLMGGHSLRKYKNQYNNEYTKRGYSDRAAKLLSKAKKEDLAAIAAKGATLLATTQAAGYAAGQLGGVALEAAGGGLVGNLLGKAGAPLKDSKGHMLTGEERLNWVAKNKPSFLLNDRTKGMLTRVGVKSDQTNKVTAKDLYQGTFSAAQNASIGKMLLKPGAARVLGAQTFFHGTTPQGTETILGPNSKGIDPSYGGVKGGATRKIIKSPIVGQNTFSQVIPSSVPLTGGASLANINTMTDIAAKIGNEIKPKVDPTTGVKYRGMPVQTEKFFDNAIGRSYVAADGLGSLSSLMYSAKLHPTPDATEPLLRVAGLGNLNPMFRRITEDVKKNEKSWEVRGAARKLEDVARDSDNTLRRIKVYDRKPLDLYTSKAVEKLEDNLAKVNERYKQNFTSHEEMLNHFNKDADNPLSQYEAKLAKRELVKKQRIELAKEGLLKGQKPKELEPKIRKGELLSDTDIETLKRSHTSKGVNVVEQYNNKVPDLIEKNIPKLKKRSESLYTESSKLYDESEQFIRSLSNPVNSMKAVIPTPKEVVKNFIKGPFAIKELKDTLYNTTPGKAGVVAGVMPSEMFDDMMEIDPDDVHYGGSAYRTKRPDFKGPTTKELAGKLNLEVKDLNDNQLDIIKQNNQGITDVIPNKGVLDKKWLNRGESSWGQVWNARTRDYGRYLKNHKGRFATGLGLLGGAGFLGYRSYSQAKPLVSKLMGKHEVNRPLDPNTAPKTRIGEVLGKFKKPVQGK